MDLWNNEILSHSLSAKRGDRMTYITGTPTDNAAMESINGRIKSELFTDFHLEGENVQEEMEAYIKFFNEERPAYSLGYLTPKQYREIYAVV
jgi:transposase InsO family protein